MKKVLNGENNKEFPFNKCFLDELDIKGNFGFIEIEDTKENVVLKKSTNNHTRFEHSDTCSCRLKKFDSNTPTPDIRISVACLIENTDNNSVLITKRPKHMRAYPLCWVVPGGGADENETLHETMTREVFEEVGLNLKNEKYEIIFSWEACWNLKKHYLIVYYNVKIDNEFLKKNHLKCELEEIDSYAWIDVDDFKRYKLCKNDEQTFDGFQLMDGQIKSKKFSMFEELVSKEKKEGEILARLSGATENLLNVFWEKK
eukprot:gene7947-12414_t